jgi:diguanylate cyclase (GGDEF)-like protein
MERIAREIRRQLKREETLRGLLRTLAGADPLETRLAGTLAGLSRLISFDAFELSYPDPAAGAAWVALRADRESLRTASGFQRRTVAHPGGSTSPAARALLLRSPISMDRYGSAGEGTLPDGFDASLTVPLFCGAEITGLMAVYSRQSGSFAHGDVALLQQFGDLVTLALERQKVAANLDHDGETAEHLGRRLPAVSACSRAEHYLADLEQVLGEVFALRGFRLFEIRKNASPLELVERVPLSPGGGRVLGEGRRSSLPAEELETLAAGRIQVAGTGGDGSALLRFSAPHGRWSEMVLIPLRVEGAPAWLVTAAGDAALLGEPATGGLLRILQNTVEQALSGMTVYRGLREDLARLSGLLSLAKVLTELSPESGVFQVVIDKIDELVDFDGCTLYLLDGDGPKLVPVVSNEKAVQPGDVTGTGGDRRRQWLESVLEVGEARMLNGCDTPGGAAEHLMASPMLHKGRPFGIFCLRRAGNRPFGAQELSLLTTLAGFTADAMHRSLQQQEQKSLRRTLSLVEQHAGEGILFLDGRMRVARASREALRLLGCTAGDLLGRGLGDHLFRNRPEADGLVENLLAGNKVEGFRTYARPLSEAPVPVAVTAALQEPEAGAAGGLVFVLRDTTGRLRLERRLKQASVTDPLTGLRNRHETYPDLAAELERGLSRDRFLSALVFRVRDLDQYNTRNGWPAGDRMVKKLGQIVGRRIRGHLDAAYRFGDGTFLVIMPDTPGGDAEAVSRRILARVTETFHGRVQLDSAVTQSRFADTPDSVLQRLFTRLEGPPENLV